MKVISSGGPIIMGYFPENFRNQGKRLALLLSPEEGEILVLRRNSPEELAWSKEVLSAFKETSKGKTKLIGYITSTTVTFSKEDPFGLDELEVWEKGREPLVQFVRRLLARKYKALFLFFRLPPGFHHWLLLLLALVAKAKKKLLLLPQGFVMEGIFRWRVLRFVPGPILREGTKLMLSLLLRFLAMVAPVRGGTCGFPKKVFLLRLDHMGDVISSIPAIRLLERYLSKRGELEVWLGPWCEGLKGLLGERIKVRIFPIPWFSRGGRVSLDWLLFPLRSFLAMLRRPDVVILPRGDPREVLWAGLLWGRKLVVPKTSHVSVWHFFRLEHVFKFVVFSAETAEHQASSDYILAWKFLKFLGVMPEEFPPEGPPPIFPPEDAVKRAFSKLGKFSRPLMVFHPFAYLGGRNWPLPKMGDLINRLWKEFGGTAVVTGSVRDLHLLPLLLTEITKEVDLRVMVGELELSELWGLISSCDLMISVDTGPLHFGSISQIPLVALFGAGNVIQWGPRHKEALVVRGSLLCGPCFMMCTGPHKPAPCMKAIEVKDVFQAAREVLRHRGFKVKGGRRNCFH